MSIATIVILNLLLSIGTIAAVAGLVRLAHRLPTRAPHDDASWGGERIVPSDPLPLAQLAAHEDTRGLARAA